MTKPPCPDQEPRLEALLFGELASGERETLEAHLEECAPCREALEDARVALEALAAIEDPPRAFEQADGAASDDAWKAFRARVETRPAPVSASSGRLLALAAVLILGIGIGWVVAPRGRTVSPPAPEDGGLEALVRADVLADTGVRYVDGLRGLFSDLTEHSFEALTIEQAVAARERARSLLRDGRLLQRSLDPDRDEHFLRAIGRAELFLEDIAALEPSGRSSVRLLSASLTASRLPLELESLDVRRDVETALQGSGSLADESLYRRKDF